MKSRHDENGRGNAENAFELNYARLKAALESLPERNLSYATTSQREIYADSYHFIEHMIRKVRLDNLPAEHRERLIALDFRYGGKHISEALEPGVSKRSDDAILGYAARRAKEAIAQAEKAERDALKVIDEARAKIEIAKAEIKEAEERVRLARERANEIEQMADETHRSLIADIHALSKARMQRIENPQNEFIGTDELAKRICYDARTVRDHFTKIMVDGVHYVRGPGGRKILWIWNNIERDLLRGVFSDVSSGRPDMEASPAE